MKNRKRTSWYRGFGKMLLLFQVYLVAAFLPVATLQASGLSDSYAQQDAKVINGTIKDETGEIIPGATVVIKGVSVGTTTDFDGNFSLTIPDDDDIVLVVSFIGYKTQEIATSSTTNYDIVLQEASIGVEEVMVVAYGVQKKESVVGAISQVKGEMLSRTGQTTVSNSLAGQIPGMVTVQQAGTPGNSDAKMYIRGMSSFSGDNSPLVLIDGVERSLDNLDPNEVESISVLKDASATAVYGVKGANGVILVTTKRGQVGRMEISGMAEMTLVKPSLERNLENSYNTLVAINDYYRNNQKWSEVLNDEILEHYRVQDMPYVYPDSDPAELMMSSFGIDTRFSLSARGGTQAVKYFVSLSAISEEGVFEDGYTQTEYDPGYRYNRYNFRTNFDFSITPTTDVSISSGGFMGTASKPAATYTYLPNFILYNAPYDSPYIYPAEFVEQYPDEDWPYSGERLAGSYITPGELTPYITSNHTGTSSNATHRLNADFSISQKLDFITKGLSAAGLISYNNEASYNNGAYKKEEEYFVFNLLANGDYEWVRYINKTQDQETIITPAYQTNTRSNDTPSKNYMYQFRLDYNNKFADVHTVTALGLFKRRISQSKASFPHYEEDWVGRLTYDYDLKYMVEMSAGYTGSEQFSPENRFGFFPSGSVGWNVAREEFVQELIPAMNEMKIRYSYGESGNDNTGSNWLYISEYTDSKNATTGDMTSGTTVPTIQEGKVPNYYAQWERSIKHNLGVNFGFLDNKFKLSIDLFDEKRDGILMERRALASWFGQDVQPQNIGETKVHGYEIEFGYRETFNKTNVWAKANFNFNENRVVAQDDPLLTPDYLKKEGMPIGQLTSLYNVGYYQDMDDMLNYSLGKTSHETIGADMCLDFNGDGVINSNDNVPSGYTTRPNYTFGVSGGMSHGRFDCSFVLQGASNVSRNYGQWFNPIANAEAQGILFEGRADQVWTPDNRDAEYANWGEWSHGQKARVHAYYVRLKSIQAAYKLDFDFVKRVGVSNLKVYVQGNNLYTYAPNVTIGDPEAEPSANDNYNYPISKRFTFGLKLNF